MANGWQNVERVAACLPDDVTAAITAIDLTTGQTADHNGGTAFPAASTVKVAILVALARALDAGAISLADRLPVRPEQVVRGTGVLLDMQPGLTLPVADHAYLMIAISDNTASNVLIDALGLPTIQRTIAELGLRALALNRRFLGRLPDPGEPENYASAADLARLFALIARDEAASPPRCAWMRELLAKQQFRERLARCLPDGVAYAGKYGTVGQYAHDAGLVTGPRGTIAIAVLTADFPIVYMADAFIGAVGRAVAADIA